ncbi:MAG: DMT family transporter [Clostridia bacterium]|nr:DMT family transporter [Clostridia bacterium]
MNKLKLSLSMLIFGTIGIFVKYIPLTSSTIAMARGYMGAAFLLFVMLLSGKKLSFFAIKKNALALVISGAAIGINWIFLFESYNYTSVAVATLCYYMQPVLLIVLAPFVLKQKLSVKKILCVPVALVGMVLVSGVLSGKQEVSLTGVALGLCAAVFYTVVVLTNRFLKDISSYDSTLIQLFVAALVITPYNFVVGVAPTGAFDVKAVIMLLVVGFLHTGLTYYLYFSSIKDLPSETVAIYSYIDPAFAILLSVFFLHEPMTVTGVVGAVLILGACVVSEIEFNKKRRG